MKKIELAMLLGMVISVFSAGFCNFAEDYNDITDKVFRLHILANSNSDEDQKLKLEVRDAVLEECSYLFEECEDAQQSADAAEAEMEFIKATAEKVIAENNYSYSVDCEVAEMHFDERVYDSVTMPAGEYLALRINIGEAKGRNWWCVMFPALCVPAATETIEECGIFSDEEIEMLKSPESYECRFYILELVDKLKKYLQSEKGEAESENL